jgi:NAD+ kinase
MPQFQTIGIIGKSGDPERVTPTLERLVRHLEQRGRAVLCDATSTALLGRPADLAHSGEELGRSCDLVVVVGGDGTLLGAARAMAAFNVPLVGINLGRLGFLADVSPDQIEGCLDRILEGAFAEEARCLLTARLAAWEGAGSDTVLGPTQPACQDMLALNDVVIHKWNTARVIEFETYINGSFVNAQRSDGIIIATPTGSTAYALSGGGPLVHPSLDVIVLVSICPHTLSNRPLVVPGDSRIEIRIAGFDQGRVHVTCDGQTNQAPGPCARILVRKAPKPARLLHPRGHDHYAILRAKLGWGGHVPANTGDQSQDPSPTTPAAGSC